MALTSNSNMTMDKSSKSSTSNETEQDNGEKEIKTKWLNSIHRKPCYMGICSMGEIYLRKKTLEWFKTGKS